MSDEYRMSYVLRCGPPKPRAELAPDEGLTDYAIFVSILCEPGTDAPVSISPVFLGPDGAAPVNAAAALAAATTLLELAQGQSAVALAGVLAIRREMRNR
mgnify:FL=1